MVVSLTSLKPTGLAVNSMVKLLVLHIFAFHQFSFFSVHHFLFTLFTSPSPSVPIT